MTTQNGDIDPVLRFKAARGQKQRAAAYSIFISYCALVLAVGALKSMIKHVPSNTSSIEHADHIITFAAIAIMLVAFAVAMNANSFAELDRDLAQDEEDKQKHSELAAFQAVRQESGRALRITSSLSLMAVVGSLLPGVYQVILHDASFPQAFNTINLGIIFAATAAYVISTFATAVYDYVLASRKEKITGARPSLSTSAFSFFKQAITKPLVPAGLSIITYAFCASNFNPALMTAGVTLLITGFILNAVFGNLQQTLEALGLIERHQHTLDEAFNDEETAATTEILLETDQDVSTYLEHKRWCEKMRKGLQMNAAGHVFAGLGAAITLTSAIVCILDESTPELNHLSTMHLAGPQIMGFGLVFMSFGLVMWGVGNVFFKQLKRKNLAELNTKLHGTPTDLVNQLKREWDSLTKKPLPPPCLTTDDLADVEETLKAHPSSTDTDEEEQDLPSFSSPYPGE